MQEWGLLRKNYLYTNLHEWFCQLISWTNWVNSGKFMDNCWISCQVMADMEKVYDNLIIINLYSLPENNLFMATAYWILETCWTRETHGTWFLFISCIKLWSKKPSILVHNIKTRDWLPKFATGLNIIIDIVQKV